MSLLRPLPQPIPLSHPSPVSYSGGRAALRILRMKISSPLIFAVGLLVASTTQAKRPFTFEDMMALKRLAEPVPTPNGKWILFAATDVDLAANSRTSHLWIVPSAGGDARRLSASPNDESRPRVSPDGRQIIFTSKAGDEPQIWIAPFDPDSGTIAEPPHALTWLSTGADGGKWSPRGDTVVFTSSVYPDCKDDAANKARDEERKKSKVKAQVFTHLFYRHWTAFADGKRSHLFAVPAGANFAPVDLTPGDHDTPPFSLGGQDDYDISPDGQEVAYSSNVEAAEGVSTNNDIFVVPITGGPARRVSTSPGSDSNPLYSPDGKYLAWRSQARNGYESDRFALLTYNRASREIKEPTAGLDRWVGSFAWAADSRAIFLTAEDHGDSPIYGVAISQPGRVVELARLHADDLAVSGDGSRLYFSRVSVDAPGRIESIDLTNWSNAAGDRKSETLTHLNDAALAGVDLLPLERFTFRGAEGAEVQGFLLKPPGFDAARKYPVKFLIHGGPEGAWGDSWSFRWNPELFAADGYVVVMVNPHGSTGYGQAFTEGVIRDWGGKPFDDLMKGLDYVEQTYPFVDKEREAALGASYGGYMANWILGHTERFKAIVTHDGVYNTETAYGTTEELWFPEWEMGGTPWENREAYRRWSPQLSADRFKTPTLVIHGQLDYRLDASQGFDLFTTLQRRGIPSEMLYFPDEGHWVLKPQNSQLWNKTVNDWVRRWTK